MDPDVSQVCLRFSGDEVTETADVRFLICGAKKCHPKGQWQKKEIIYSLLGVLSQSSLRLSHTRAVSKEDHQGAVLARIPTSVSAAQEHFNNLSILDDMSLIMSNINNVGASPLFNKLINFIE